MVIYFEFKYGRGQFKPRSDLLHGTIVLPAGISSKKELNSTMG